MLEQEPFPTPPGLHWAHGTFPLQGGGQRQEVSGKETKPRFPDVVSDDGQQPAPGEIQSFSGRREGTPGERELTAWSRPPRRPGAAQALFRPLLLTSAHTELPPQGVDTLPGYELRGSPGAGMEARQGRTYSEPSISKGTASKTTSGPMLATAAPTARSRAAVWGKWGERRRSQSDCRH